MEESLLLLRKQSESQSLFIVELQQENTYLKEMISQMQNRKFGAKSDRIDVPNQPDLFNEAEAVAEQTPDVDEPTEVVVKAYKRGGRRKLPKALPRTTIVHDIPEAEKQCSECDQQMSVIGVDRTEKLKYIPATMEVEVHERPKYGCKSCECAPKQAKPAPQAIPKSMATASLLAHVLISKFIDATPLYRQQQQWKRLGIDLGRALLSSWVVKCGVLLTCLWELMQQDLQSSDYVQADETTLQVLHEDGRTAAQKSYMWLFQCGPPGKRIILYLMIHRAHLMWLPTYSENHSVVICKPMVIADTMQSVHAMVLPARVAWHMLGESSWMRPNSISVAAWRMKPLA